jgi:hypothetical protein
VLPLLLTREQGRLELAGNGDMRTVFVAERWRSEADDELLLFYESSPAPRAEGWFR